MSNRKYVVANDFSPTITGFNDIHITPILVLTNIFHEPKLSFYIIFMQQLTPNLNWYVFVSPSYWVFFKDKVWGGGMKLLREKKNGLYHLE
jgi:hypothetical protein